MNCTSTSISHWLIILSTTIWLFGCDPNQGAGGNGEPTELEETPSWPEISDDLPPCATDGGLFEPPDLPEATGQIHLYPSTSLVPLGLAERMHVEVYKDGENELDYHVEESLQLDLGDAGAVIDVTPVEEGRADATVAFSKLGIHNIKASLGSQDNRSGIVTVSVYKSQLPVWEMAIDTHDLKTIVDNPRERIKVPAVITIDGQSYETKVRIHGGTSRDYRKKSFRFDLEQGFILPDGSNHLILRAEWADKTMLRNYLGFEIFRYGTWLPTPKTEIVHFRINNRFYGAMWHVERIDGDFLRSRGLNPDGSMYEADPSSDYWFPGGNLTPLRNYETYRAVYQHQKGDIDYDDLISLIETTLTLPDKTFRNEINNVVNVNSILVYMAAMAVIQNHDHIKKNYYIYRDHLADDDRWVIFPWDLDLSLGHLWTEENDILDEQIFYDASLYVGEKVPEHAFYMQLMSRLWGVPEFDDRFLDYVDHILDTVFTPEFTNPRIDNVLCRAAPEIVSDDRQRAELDEYLDRVDEIREFVDQRRAYIQDSYH